MKIRTDCHYYRTNKPCVPHKQSGVRCESCTEYEPVDQRILIVKLDSLGDVLRTTSCLKPLKELYPLSHITWLSKSNAFDLLKLNPLIDEILSVESNYLEFLLCREFDFVLGPDPDPLSAAITRIAKATTKRGFVADHKGGVVPLNDAARDWWLMGLDDSLKSANRRTYCEWLYDICELPTPVARPLLQLSDSTKHNQARFLSARMPDAERWVCLNTGSSLRWQEKRWKLDYFGQLADMLTRDDPATGVVLIGGPEESELNHKIVQSFPGFVDAGTDNSVEDFAALITLCEWILTPDSLGYHVACAVNTPAVCLVGPTSPWELDLYGMNRVVHSDLECISCYHSKCPFTVTCMDYLTPKQVHSLLTHNTFSSGISALPPQHRQEAQALSPS
jgi:heptosyltransferase-2